MSNKEIIPFTEIQSSGVDLNQITTQAQKMIHALRQMGLKEATFESGVYFSHDNTENTNTLATDGVLVEQRTHTTSITFRHENSSEQEVLAELNTMEITQKAQGAFSDGKSQSWVSLQHKEKDDD
jgi:hypothetical protein